MICRFSHRLLLVVLSGDDAILLDLAFVHVAHCGHKFEGGGGRLCGEAFDDVVLVSDLARH